jgi:DNA-binding response OmpR family regulator
MATAGGEGGFAMKIFLVEDDIGVGSALLSVFQDEGHTVVWCRLAAGVVERIRTEYFDLLVLDLGLPDADGGEILAALREDGRTLPVLVITARESLQDRLSAFAIGADDYLIKPFAIPELLARLRAVVRRAGLVPDGREPEWRAGALVLQERSKSVTLAGEVVALSKTEYALLLALLQQAGRVLTRAEIESRALPHSDVKTLDVHIFNLRKKIGEGFIRTVRGVGYMIEPDAV